MRIKLKDIRLDGGTQPRQFINQDVVAEYADEMVETDNFPPVVVFHDGANYWLADGFHRYFANKKAGFVDVEADVRTGTLREAVLYSVGANSSHGLRRTNEDKRKAVMTLLNDIEWSEWSDGEIARKCAVSTMTVGRVRKSMGLEQSQKKYTNKQGTVTTMRVDNIKPSETVIMSPLETMDERLREWAVAHTELAEENARLMDKLNLKVYEATPEEKAAILDTVESLRAQIKQLEAELSSVKLSRDDYQNKNSELLRQVNYWKKRAEKAEKLAA